MASHKKTMMQMVHDTYMLPRNLVSTGYDKALDYFCDQVPFRVEAVPSGTKCWTWTVPQRWDFVEGWIKDEDGNVVLDASDHPLRVMSYSLPVDEWVSREELLNHVHVSDRQEDSIPFEYCYYKRTWGFCARVQERDALQSEKYHVCIRTREGDGSLKIGELVIPGTRDEEIVLVAHLCHPAMVNDDLSGCVALVELARRFLESPLQHTVRLLMLPETIGSIAYLSQNEPLIDNMKWGIFLEMLGNDNDHVLQRSKRDTTVIDRVAERVMAKELSSHRSGAFREVVGNDEMVFDGPGVNVPMISVSRWPYSEYHTSADNPSIVTQERLEESVSLIGQIVSMLDRNYYPVRQFRGPVFLTEYDLFVDWYVNPELSCNIQKIMLRFEGDKSVLDIADELNLDFEDVYACCEKFAAKGLVNRSYVPVNP